MSQIESVGVAGCGLMGSGIAQVAAQAGYRTVVREVDRETLDRGLGSIRSSLERAVRKEKISADRRDEVLGRIEGTVDLEDLAGCDLVIEAIVEDRDAKTELFRALDELCGPKTTFASNTSSLSITELASATRRPDRFVGLHFFNPVPVMKLVEVVRCGTTSGATFHRAVAFAETLGKTPIACRDNGGFIVNRLLVPYMLDAIRVYEAGVGSIPDIDAGMRLGCGHPMGPFTLADFVGVDTLYRIAEIMYEEYRETRFAPPPLLKRMFAAGQHGRKTGAGFYDYSDDEPAVSDFVRR